MVEKQASSEIAQSRERFEKWYSKGHKFSFVRRKDIPEAYEDGETEVRWYTWQAAERDTRERCAQLLIELADKYDNTEKRKELGILNWTPGTGEIIALAERILGR